MNYQIFFNPPQPLPPPHGPTVRGFMCRQINQALLLRKWHAQGNVERAE